MAQTSGSYTIPATPQQDFWRGNNVQPDGTNDTTEAIRRLGDVGIGGAAITDVIPDATTPSANNANLHLSSDAANRGQVFFGNSPLSYYLTRTVPIVVNNYVELFNFNLTNGAQTVFIHITVSDAGFSVTKTYLCNLKHDATANIWAVLRPLGDSGPFNTTGDFELLHRVATNVATFRLRRTLGTVAGTAKIRVEYVGAPEVTFTEQTASGTDATVYTTVASINIPDFWRSGNGTGFPDVGSDPSDNIAHSGNVMIGALTPNTSAARLDLTGAAVFRPVTIADIPTNNSSIGTAATTVDIASTILLSQTTANRYLTLPAPTNTQAGRILSVVNAGTTSVAISGHWLEAGTGATFLWTTAGWRRTGDVTNQYPTAAYAFTGAAPSFSPNSGLNTTVDGVSTMPASTVTYAMYDGDYVSPISLPPAAGRIGGLSFYRGSTSNVTIVTANTDLGAPMGVGVGQQAHFWSDGFVWRWSPYPVLPAGQVHTADFWRSGVGATLPDTNNDIDEAIARTGNMAIGQANPTLVAAKVDLTGALLTRTIDVTNIAANGAIGTAAATVDITSLVRVSQTTPGINLTIPNPTNLTVGRTLTVVNQGSVQFRLGNTDTTYIYLTPGQAVSFVWTGVTTGWVSMANTVGFINLTASRASLVTDHMKTLLGIATPVTVTVNTNTFIYGIFRVRQTAIAGIIKIAVGAGMTLVAPYGAVTAGLNGAELIVEVIGTNVYVS